MSDLIESLEARAEEKWLASERERANFKQVYEELDGAVSEEQIRYVLERIEQVKALGGKDFEVGLWNDERVYEDEGRAFLNGAQFSLRYKRPKTDAEKADEARAEAAGKEYQERLMARRKEEDYALYIRLKAQFGDKS